MNHICPVCDCTNEKTCHSTLIGNIYKCKTCECYFDDNRILKKKYSKLTAIWRNLQ